jgi:hypothetical protein
MGLFLTELIQLYINGMLHFIKGASGIDVAIQLEELARVKGRKEAEKIIMAEKKAKVKALKETEKSKDKSSKEKASAGAAAGLITTDPMLYYVAQLNNCDFYETHSVTMMESISDCLVSSPTLAQRLEDGFEELSNAYIDLAALCVDVIVFSAMQFLQPFASDLFTIKW